MFLKILPLAHAYSARITGLMPAGVPFDQREWKFGLFCGARESPKTFRSEIMVLLKLALSGVHVKPKRASRESFQPYFTL
jgi:hypothetical protein